LVFIFFVLFIVIVGSFKDEYDEKGQILFGAKNYLFIIGPHIYFLIFILILVFFHYYRRRIDILKKSNTLFIGITTFCQKFYKKKYLLELDSIEECGFLENTKTLSIKLKNGNRETIWKFNENKEDLKIISNRLDHLI